VSLFNKNHSSSDSSQKTSTATSSENNNAQGGASGITIGKLDLTGGSSPTLIGKGGGGGVNIVNTDAGAIKGSQDLARTTIDAARSITGDSAALAKSISQGVLDFASSTGRTVADSALTSQKNALNFGSDTVSRSFDFGQSSLSSSLTFGRNALSEVDKALQSTISTNNAAFETVARSQSTNVALSDLTTNVFKSGVTLVGIIAAAAVVAVIAWKSK
jgi:hypothetical protein